MLKYRLYILAVIYLLITLFLFMLGNARGCYIYPRGSDTMEVLQSEKFYFYSKKAITLDQLNIGDIVLITSTHDAELIEPFRIIGKPGAVIELKEGVFYNQGTAIELPFTAPPIAGVPPTLAPVSVPSAMLFVAPENLNSIKVETFPFFVDMNQVKGKLLRTFLKDESL